MRKPVAWDIIAIILAVLMIIPVLIGLGIADIHSASVTIEVREFKKEQHAKAIASAFQFELAPNETLSVERFFRGFLQARMELDIVVEGIESKEDFLSRFYSELVEIRAYTSPEMKDGKPLLTTNGYQIPAFYPAHREFRHGFGLSEDEDGITAKFFTRGGTPPPLGEAVHVLVKYLPSRYLHPFFLVPLAIQASLILFVVVRFIRRIIPKKRNEKGQNEGV
ncbi:MAG: hypothetical protein FWG87_02495 [Defluviitaleaceae bacterium]|nr:hypothetical protein [Defluviitaleaceae bacterium]